jgi:hypothetical protein
MWVALSIDKQLAILDTRQRKIHQVTLCPCPPACPCKKKNHTEHTHTQKVTCFRFLKQSEIRAWEKEEREKRAAAGEIVEDEEGDGRKGQARGLV